MIPNCLVTKAKILWAEDIFGTNVGSLQGKRTHKKQPELLLKQWIHQQEWWHNMET